MENGVSAWRPFDVNIASTSAPASQGLLLRGYADPPGVTFVFFVKDVHPHILLKFFTFYQTMMNTEYCI